jgi:hypothetical protein
MIWEACVSTSNCYSLVAILMQRAFHLVSFNRQESQMCPLRNPWSTYLRGCQRLSLCSRTQQVSTKLIFHHQISIAFDWKERVQKMKETREIIDIMVTREDYQVSRGQNRGDSLLSARSSHGTLQVNSIDEMLKALRFPLLAQILDTRS